MISIISMGSACAYAQAPAFKVPFDFSVGNQVLPAGTYLVSYYAPENAIMVRSEDGRFHAFTAIQPDDPSTRDRRAVFTKYGNQYFLHEVICGAVAMNIALPTSRMEKQAPFPRERGIFNDVRWLAVLDSNVLVFGSIESVRAELDRYLGRTSPDPGLIRNLGRLRSKDQTWCVLSPPARNDEIYSALAGLSPELAELARSGDAFEFGLHYGRRVEFEYVVTVASTAGSRPSSDSLRQAPVGSARNGSLLPALSTTGNVDPLHRVIEVSMSRYEAWLAEVRGEHPHAH